MAAKLRFAFGTVMLFGFGNAFAQGDGPPAAPASATDVAAEEQQPPPPAPSPPQAEPGPRPQHLVGVILDTRQALLWDESVGKYVLREAGEMFAGDRIVAVEKDRLVCEQKVWELEAAPLVARKTPRRLPAVIIMASASADGAPADAAAASAHATAPVPLAPAVHAIGRRELEAELRDFGALARKLEVAPSPGGGWQLVRIDKGCVLHKVGLRDGDVVRRISDLPLNTFDDAATAYALVRSANHVSVELVRDGRPMTLWLKIQG